MQNEELETLEQDSDTHFEPSSTDEGLGSEEGKEQKFKEGQILKFVRVRFPGNARSFPFLIGRRRLTYGQKVVAMSDRGMAVGYVNSFPYDAKFEPAMLPVRSISKVATEEDIQKQYEHYKQEKRVETICANLIEKHRLEMNLTHVEFTQFGKKVVFYFIAPARVDFRELVKDLVNDLKLRIELRQISVRDRSASLGGIGPCGRQLCCSSFLSQYGNVSIKMAKTQNLSLNSNKLNGVCGQLKCCIAYEDEVYEHKRSKLPKEKEIISVATGEKGRVLRIHVLSEQFDMLTAQGTIRRYSLGQYKGQAPRDFIMPEQFDHIVDETAVVIGLDLDTAEKARHFERDIEKIKAKTKDYAKETYHQVFSEHFFEGKENEAALKEVVTQAPVTEQVQLQQPVRSLNDESEQETAAPIAPPRNEQRPQQRHHHQHNRQHSHDNRRGPRQPQQQNRAPQNQNKPTTRKDD